MPNDAPNDAKQRLDQVTHRLQDQPTTADPAHPASRHVETNTRQPLQSQQRDVTGTTLPVPDDMANGKTDTRSNQHDYGRKTGAAEDHPYADDAVAPDPAPDNPTEIDSEADLGDPSNH